MSDQELVQLTIEINAALRFAHNVVPAFLATLLFALWGKQKRSPLSLATALVLVCYGLAGVAGLVTYLATLLIMRVFFLSPAIWIVFGIDALTLLVAFFGSIWLARKVSAWPLVASSNSTPHPDAREAPHHGQLS